MLSAAGAKPIRAGVLIVVLVNDVNGLHFGFPANTTVRRRVAIAEIERRFTLHLGLEPETFLQVLVLIPEAIVLFNQRNDVGVEVKHARVQFKILDLMNRVCYALCIVENAQISPPTTTPQSNHELATACRPNPAHHDRSAIYGSHVLCQRRERSFELPGRICLSW